MEKRAAPLFSPGDESSPGPGAGSRKAERRSEANAERRSELASRTEGPAGLAGFRHWPYNVAIPPGKKKCVVCSSFERAKNRKIELVHLFLI